VRPASRVVAGLTIHEIPGSPFLGVIFRYFPRFLSHSLRDVFVCSDTDLVVTVRPGSLEKDIFLVVA